jgi:pentose-5-phosphate-3-epimerase
VNSEGPEKIRRLNDREDTCTCEVKGKNELTTRKKLLDFLMFLSRNLDFYGQSFFSQVFKHLKITCKKKADEDKSSV